MNGNAENAAKRKRESDARKERRRRNNLNQIEMLVEDLNSAVEDNNYSRSSEIMLMIAELVHIPLVGEGPVQYISEISTLVIKKSMMELFDCNPLQLLLVAVIRFNNDREFVHSTLAVIYYFIIAANSNQMANQTSTLISPYESCTEASMSLLLGAYKNDGEVASLIFRVVYWFLRIRGPIKKLFWPCLPFPSNGTFPVDLIQVMQNFPYDSNIRECGIHIILYLLSKHRQSNKYTNGFLFNCRTQLGDIGACEVILNYVCNVTDHAVLVLGLQAMYAMVIQDEGSLERHHRNCAHFLAMGYRFEDFLDTFKSYATEYTGLSLNPELLIHSEMLTGVDGQNVKSIINKIVSAVFGGYHRRFMFQGIKTHDRHKDGYGLTYEWHDVHGNGIHDCYINREDSSAIMRFVDWKCKDDWFSFPGSLDIFGAIQDVGYHLADTIFYLDSYGRNIDHANHLFLRFIPYLRCDWRTSDVGLSGKDWCPDSNLTFSTGEEAETAETRREVQNNIDSYQLNFFPKDEEELLKNLVAMFEKLFLSLNADDTPTTKAVLWSILDVTDHERFLSGIPAHLRPQPSDHPHKTSLMLFIRKHPLRNVLPVLAKYHSDRELVLLVMSLIRNICLPWYRDVIAWVESKHVCESDGNINWGEAPSVDSIRVENEISSVSGEGESCPQNTPIKIYDETQKKQMLSAQRQERRRRKTLSNIEVMFEDLSMSFESGCLYSTTKALGEIAELINHNISSFMIFIGLSPINILLSIISKHLKDRDCCLKSVSILYDLSLFRERWINSLEIRDVPHHKYPTIPLKMSNSIYGDVLLSLFSEYSSDKTISLLILRVVGTTLTTSTTKFAVPIHMLTNRNFQTTLVKVMSFCIQSDTPSAMEDNDIIQCGKKVIMFLLSVNLTAQSSLGAVGACEVVFSLVLTNLNELPSLLLLIENKAGFLSLSNFSRLVALGDKFTNFIGSLKHHTMISGELQSTSKRLLELLMKFEYLRSIRPSTYERFLPACRALKSVLGIRRYSVAQLEDLVQINGKSDQPSSIEWESRIEYERHEWNPFVNRAWGAYKALTDAINNDHIKLLIPSSYNNKTRDYELLLRKIDDEFNHGRKHRRCRNRSQCVRCRRYDQSRSLIMEELSKVDAKTVLTNCVAFEFSRPEVSELIPQLNYSTYCSNIFGSLE